MAKVNTLAARYFARPGALLGVILSAAIIWTADVAVATAQSPAKSQSVPKPVQSKIACEKVGEDNERIFGGRPTNDDEVDVCVQDIKRVGSQQHDVIVRQLAAEAGEDRQISSNPQR